jgi:hypothetical protein
MPRPVSLGRAALARLVEQYGVDTVAGWLHDIAASPTPSKRGRGRPKGPSRQADLQDTRLAQAATARWREAGGRRWWETVVAVWPFLLEVSGNNESTARRLHRRLEEWGAEGCAERGIADFNSGLWRVRLGRAVGRVNGDAEHALHTLAAGYRRRYSVNATDAEVLFRSIPNFVARLDAAKFAARATFDDAWATVRHLSADRFSLLTKNPPETGPIISPWTPIGAHRYDPLR